MRPNRGLGGSTRSICATAGGNWVESEVKIWRSFVAIAETINTGATPVAKA